MTAELAVALVPAVALLLLAAWLAAAGSTQVAAQLAAGAAARALARGESPTVVAAQVSEAVGHGASTQQQREGDLVRVRVTAVLAVPLLGQEVQVSGDAVAPLEVVPP